MATTLLYSPDFRELRKSARVEEVEVGNVRTLCESAANSCCANLMEPIVKIDIVAFVTSPDLSVWW